MTVSSKRLHALWWWIDRWRKSTAYTDMTLEEQGAYRNLLDEAHLRGGGIPNDERILARACGDALAWERVRAAVLARFTLREDGWHNETLDSVRERSAALSDLQAEKGRARSASAGREAGRFATSTPAGHQPENQPKLQPPNHPPSPSPSPSPSDGLTDGRGAVVPLPQRPQAGRPAGEGRVPSNPLVDRRAYEAEFLRLVRELADLTDRDPVEVAREASSYEGARTSPINPASMTDDRLANSVLDLRSNLQAAKAKAERESRGIREAR